MDVKPIGFMFLAAIDEMKSKRARNGLVFDKIRHSKEPHEKVYSQATVVALQARIAELEKDAARLEFVLPLLGGDDDEIAGDRAFAIMTAMLKGIEGKPGIDAAIDAMKG